MKPEFFRCVFSGRDTFIQGGVHVQAENNWAVKGDDGDTVPRDEQVQKSQQRYNAHTHT